MKYYINSHNGVFTIYVVPRVGLVASGSFTCVCVLCSPLVCLCGAEYVVPIYVFMRINEKKTVNQMFDNYKV